MHKLRSLSQQKISLFIALYLGILLNLPIFFRRYGQLHYNNVLSIAVEMLACFALVYFLTLLLSFTGKTIFRVLLSVIVVSSVAASYYMILFNVDIGYGILAAALASDSIDLSKESIGTHFAGWVVLFSLLPLVLLWASKMPGAALKETRPKGLLKKVVLLIAAGLVCYLPQLSLRLDLYDRVIDLVAEGVDLEILVGDDIPEQHIGKKLAQHQRILCASPDYLKAHGVPESLEALTQHQCLVLKERDNPFGIWSVTAEGEEQRIRVKGALSSNSGEVVLQWALKHHGIILRSQWDVQPYLDSGELVQVLPAYSQPASVWAVYPTRLAESAKLRVCVEFFQQRFSQLLG